MYYGVCVCVCVCGGGLSSSWQNLNAGVLQESLSGPTLFIIFINDIVNRINSNTRLWCGRDNLAMLLFCVYL